MKKKILQRLKFTTEDEMAKIISMMKENETISLQTEAATGGVL